MSYTDLPPTNMSSVDDLSSYDPTLWDDTPATPLAESDICLPADEEAPTEDKPDDEGGSATAGLPETQKYPLPEIAVSSRTGGPVATPLPVPAKETGDAVLDDLLFAGLDLGPTGTESDAGAESGPAWEPDVPAPADELLVPPGWDTPPLLATLGSGAAVSDGELLALTGGSPRVAAQAQRIVDDNKRVVAALDPDVFQIYLPGTGHTDEQRERQLAALDRQAHTGGFGDGFLP